MSLNKLFTKFDASSKKMNNLLQTANLRNLDSAEKSYIDLRSLMEALRQFLADIEREFNSSGPSIQKENFNKIRITREDFENKETQFKKFEDKYKLEEKKQSLINNRTNGVNNHDDSLHRVTRDAVLDLHKETDLQDRLLDGIHSDIVQSTENMKTVSKELVGQGETLVRVHDNVQKTNIEVNRAGKTINVMERRAICHKILLNLLAVLLFIAIIIVSVLKIMKLF